MGRYGFSPAHLLKVQKMPTFRVGDPLEEPFALSKSVGKEALAERRLAVLFRISKREWASAEPDQIGRLMRRSFVKKEADNTLDQPRKAAWPYGSNGFQEADIPLRDATGLSAASKRLGSSLTDINPRPFALTFP